MKRLSGNPFSHALNKGLPPNRVRHESTWHVLATTSADAFTRNAILIAIQLGITLVVRPNRLCAVRKGRAILGKSSSRANQKCPKQGLDGDLCVDHSPKLKNPKHNLHQVTVTRQLSLIANLLIGLSAPQLGASLHVGLVSSHCGGLQSWPSGAAPQCPAPLSSPQAVRNCTGSWIRYGPGSG